MKHRISILLIAGFWLWSFLPFVCIQGFSQSRFYGQPNPTYGYNATPANASIEQLWKNQEYITNLIERLDRSNSVKMQAFDANRFESLKFLLALDDRLTDISNDLAAFKISTRDQVSRLDNGAKALAVRPVLPNFDPRLDLLESNLLGKIYANAEVVDDLQKSISDLRHEIAGLQAAHAEAISNEVNNLVHELVPKQNAKPNLNTREILQTIENEFATNQSVLMAVSTESAVARLAGEQQILRKELESYNPQELNKEIDQIHKALANFDDTSRSIAYSRQAGDSTKKSPAAGTSWLFLLLGLEISVASIIMLAFLWSMAGLKAVNTKQSAARREFEQLSELVENLRQNLGKFQQGLPDSVAKIKDLETLTGELRRLLESVITINPKISPGTSFQLMGRIPAQAVPDGSVSKGVAQIEKSPQPRSPAPADLELSTGDWVGLCYCYFLNLSAPTQPQEQLKEFADLLKMRFPEVYSVLLYADRKQNVKWFSTDLKGRDRPPFFLISIDHQHFLIPLPADRQYIELIGGFKLENQAHPMTLLRVKHCQPAILRKQPGGWVLEKEGFLGETPGPVIKRFGTWRQVMDTFHQMRHPGNQF